MEESTSIDASVEAGSGAHKNKRPEWRKNFTAFFQRATGAKRELCGFGKQVGEGLMASAAILIASLDSLGLNRRRDHDEEVA